MSSSAHVMSLMHTHVWDTSLFITFKWHNWPMFHLLVVIRWNQPRKSKCGTSNRKEKQTCNDSVTVADLSLWQHTTLISEVTITHLRLATAMHEHLSWLTFWQIPAEMVITLVPNRLIHLTLSGVISFSSMWPLFCLESLLVLGSMLTAAHRAGNTVTSLSAHSALRGKSSSKWSPMDTALLLFQWQSFNTDLKTRQKIIAP